ncbi:MAG: type I-B CRISPR-associated endonuclease Cas1 [Candidatus Mcinerneyibacterium aminivorans]|uniref:CRISPR-associated endonuclease Cas1 n=1 Tax=Candidatus Mcinerneyibacterium aminivorans TaxID=2703815 RepID=A0A5D0MBY9_9BACT|nr:MAG: type I-B CRISPR-associated endonuclease Cas1 [Candidatus Mcinerneyibacterium aminivorans]
MKETTYIFSNGSLRRKDNTICFETENNKKYLPIEHIKEIFIFGEVDINKRLIGYLSQKEIILSYFNYYGYYMGSFYPRKHYNSGFMILKQSLKYNDKTERLRIAKKFVKGAVKNCLKILKYYNRRNKNLKNKIDVIEEIKSDINKQQEISTLMSVEAAIKKEYYDAFNKIVNNEKFKFEKRSKRPPKDYINTLISFGNSLIYTYVLNEIYKTHLDPRIGFLHTTNYRRFTLNLDIAEIFKPVIGDRTIFKVINKNIITEDDFDKDTNGIILKENGKKRFIEKIEKRLKQTIKHSNLKKRVSYRRLIRLELYKLQKHVMNEKSYKPFVMDW